MVSSPLLHLFCPLGKLVRFRLLAQGFERLAARLSCAITRLKFRRRVGINRDAKLVLVLHPVTHCVPVRANAGAWAAAAQPGQRRKSAGRARRAGSRVGRRGKRQDVARQARPRRSAPDSWRDFGPRRAAVGRAVAHRAQQQGARDGGAQRHAATNNTRARAPRLKTRRQRRPGADEQLPPRIKFTSVTASNSFSATAASSRQRIEGLRTF